MESKSEKDEILSEHQIRSRIIPLKHAIQSQEQALLVLQKQASDFFSTNKSLTDYYHLLDRIHRLERKIQKKKQESAFLQKQLDKEPSSASALHFANSNLSSPKASNAHSSATSPTHVIRYPSVAVGDYCQHKVYGNGLVYFKKGNSFKIFFWNKPTRTFSCNDPDFADKTLVIKNPWNRTTGRYALPFSCPPSSIPESLQKSFSAFIKSQNQSLCHFISLLRLSSKSPSPSYAQSALDCIYNIEHGEEVFLRLQKSGFTPPQSKPAEPIIKFISPEPPKTSLSKPVLSKVSSPVPPTKIQYKPASDTLYVYSGRIKCIRDNHTMTCVNALIDTASGEVAKLNVNCCLNCNRFYISYDEYERYMAKYKSLLTRIVLVNQNGESTFTNNLAAESILKLCGYSVSQEKGLSQAERQRLLAKIIHTGIVNKPDVIQHLNWLIKMNGKKAGNDIAKEKWEDDLFFVRNLDMRSQTNHKISSVSPYSSKKTKKRY